MKTLRNLTILVLTLCLLGAAIGGPVKDALIARILAAKVENFINNSLPQRVLENHSRNFSGGTLDFYSAYDSCRGTVYKDLFVDGTSGSAPDYWTTYSQLRTVAAAHFKTYLNTGNNLRTTYKSCQKKLVEVASTQSPEFREKLLAIIGNLLQSFALVKSDGGRADIMLAIIKNDAETGARTHNLQQELDQMLASNRPAAEIAAKISGELANPVASGTIPPQIGDLDAAKFALRRWKEGGAALVEKYVEVLRMAETDVKSTL